MAVTFTLNGKPQTVDVSPQMPLLWVLRDSLGMTGTKFGCGMALCGCCTVHINGQPIRSCVTPISTVAGKSVTTIEGLSSDNSHPVQRAWIEVDVPQCGYCQSGQIMTAAGLLKKTAHTPPTPISTRPCTATSAAAGPTRPFATPFTWPPSIRPRQMRIGVK
jgi:isoquinoline 1-oxidoreductase alpha subunit